MHDYFNVLYHIPLHLYNLLSYIAQIVIGLPWPSFERIFQGIVVAIISWIVLYVPKTKAELRLRRIERATHKKHTDKMSDKQSAASVISGVSSVFTKH